RVYCYLACLWCDERWRGDRVISMKGSGFPMSLNQNILNDLFSQKHNPYPYYAQLREREPLARFAWGSGEMWLATAYDDVAAILKDPRFVLDGQKVKPATGELVSPLGNGYVPLAWSRHLLNTDPPDHTRLRTLVAKVFTPRMIEQL